MKRFFISHGEHNEHKNLIIVIYGDLLSLVPPGWDSHSIVIDSHLLKKYFRVPLCILCEPPCPYRLFVQFVVKKIFPSIRVPLRIRGLSKHNSTKKQLNILYLRTF